MSLNFDLKSTEIHTQTQTKQNIQPDRQTSVVSIDFGCTG